jgi:hypothetical protein
MNSHIPLDIDGKTVFVKGVDGDPDFNYKPNNGWTNKEQTVSKLQSQRQQEINRVYKAKLHYIDSLKADSEKHRLNKPKVIATAEKTIENLRMSIEQQKAIILQAENYIRECEERIARREREIQESDEISLSKPTIKAKVAYETVLEHYSYNYRPYSLFLNLPRDYIHYNIHKEPKDNLLTEEDSPEKREYLKMLKECNGDAEMVERLLMERMGK